MNFIYPDFCLMLEGCDNVGKSTLIHHLQEALPDSKVIRQPSESNSVGFIRNLVKNNKSYSPLERQLLHTVSHLVDLIEEFRTSESTILMDRSPLSAYPYGSCLGLTEDQISLILKINLLTYDNFFKKSSIIPKVVYINNDHPFKEEEDLVYGSLSWYDVKKQYDYLFDTGLKSQYGIDWEIIKIKNEGDPAKVAQKIVDVAKLSLGEL